MSAGERYALAPFYSFSFLFLHYFLPISYQYGQEVDEEDERIGGGDG